MGVECASNCWYWRPWAPAAQPWPAAGVVVMAEAAAVVGAAALMAEAAGGAVAAYPAGAVGGAASTAVGWGHGGHCCSSSVGIYFGSGFAYGYPYPYYAYPYPYPYSYPYPYYPGYYSYSSPTQYVEQGQTNEGGGGVVPQAAYWYHCGKPNGYYPYVKTCPSGWQRVPAQPPGR